MELESRTFDELKIKLEEDGSSQLKIKIEYDGHPKEKWEGVITIDQVGADTFYGLDFAEGNGTYFLFIDMLSSDISLQLEDSDNPITINGSSKSEGEYAPLSDLIQHYLKQPADGTYDLYYKKYRDVIDGTQKLLYYTTEDTVGGTEPTLDLLEIGGGILTMESDYNFMIDQSYIYDNGAVILKQEDGAVFKVEPPIFVDNDSVTNDLIISFQTVVLTGDRVVSGNGLETIQTVLASPEYMASGLTDNITIIKDTTSDLYHLWNSYFSDLGNFVNSTSANSTDMSNGYDQVGINIYSTDKNILLTVQTKEIDIT